MKKNLAKNITLSILAGAVLMSSSVVWAGVVTEPPITSGENGWSVLDGVWHTNGKEIVLDRNFSSFYPNITSAYGDTSIAAQGKVTITGGTFANVYGGYSNSSDAISNKVNFTGGKSYGFVYGGYTKNGDAINNTLTISGGQINARVFGGYTGNGNAEGNIVTISGGTIGVSGTDSGTVTGGHTQNGDAKGNTVTISGGTIGGILRGGSAEVGNAINNTVNIAGDIDLSNTRIYGGMGSGDVKSGNVLNIGYDEGAERKSWTNGNSVKAIYNFEKINFNNVEWEKDATVLKVDAVSTVVQLDGTNINIRNMKNASGNKPEVGEKMTLIEINVPAPSISGSKYESTSSFKIGSFLRAEGKIFKTENNMKIDLELTKVSANEQILAIGESRAAASALTNQGSELIETGLDALARDNDKDTKVFAALYGNASEYETGSHVKVNGWNGIVGVGKTNDKGVTMGAFFENGEGNYRTFNEYKGEFMRGDGEACYNGGGFIYRKDNANGVYTEASLRAGNLQNELRNVVIAGDELVGYDIDTFYYGAHVGVGKVIPRGNEGDSIDVYGKFIYAHYDDEDFTIDGGKFHLDSIESERLRLGFRINEVQSNKLNMYYGAAWEYEFGGDSNNAVVGYDIDINSPSLEGSTVIGEVGMHYKASEKWSFDLNGRAYVGQREGFSGSVQANYAF